MTHSTNKIFIVPFDHVNGTLLLAGKKLMSRREELPHLVDYVHQNQKSLGASILARTSGLGSYLT